MAPFYEREEIARLKRRAQRLVKLIDQNMPKTIIAAEILNILHSGLLVCGAALASLIFEWYVARIQMSAGICSQCEKAPIPPIDTHLPICWSCNAVNTLETQKLNEELEQYINEEKPNG